MDLILTIVIGLLILYLLIKYFCKKKISKKEEYTDPVQTVINEMKKKNSMDTLGEYFYVTLSVGYRNNDRVKKAYADQEARILYGDKLDKIKSFEELGKLNMWWNSQPTNLRQIPYIIRYKKMISDGLRYAFILSDESDKDKLNLLFENSPLNTNPAVIKAYNKRRKELYVPLVDAAIERIKTGDNGKQDLDYFNQITKDIIDFSETDDYIKISWDKVSLKKYYTNQLKTKLSNFIDGGKPNETGLNTSDKQMSYYTWLVELENYWLRLPEWIREYKKDEIGSLAKVFKFNYKVVDIEVSNLYTAELRLQDTLEKLVSYHNKVPQRVKMFPLYQIDYKAIFKVVYDRAKKLMKSKISKAKNRNLLVDFRIRSEADPNFQGFFGVGDNIHVDTPSILAKFWETYDELTISEKQEALDNIKNTVENSPSGVSVFFELLLLWENYSKIPVKQVGTGSERKFVPDTNYAHHNWISRLHKHQSARFSTSFDTSGTDTNTRSDVKDTSIYSVYKEYLDQYTDIEYNKFSDDLDTTTGLGFVAGLNNITVIFNDSYFRDFIFKNQGVYNTMYTKIVNRWNEVFTNFAEKCFPKSDQVVQYTHYKTRWENILKNKYYELITDGNVQIIEQAYTSNPYIKEQVIKEIGSIVSVIVLEAFINMLPITFQNDTDIQRAYEIRVVTSLEADMKSYSSMVALLEYWIGVKLLFRNLQAVKNLFHSIALDLMKKDIFGQKINELAIEWNPGDENIKSGTGTHSVYDLINYWVNIMNYKVIQNNTDYEEIIKTSLKYLFPIEVNSRGKVSDLTNKWNDSHKFVRTRYKNITWDTFFIRLEELYIRDISGFYHPNQYENLVEYWRALDPIVRGQEFAWPAFIDIFEKLVKEKIQILTTSGDLKEKIWKHKDLLKYSAAIITAYGNRINKLIVDEAMAKNVGKLLEQGECPGNFPYAYAKKKNFPTNSCCKHDPYINNEVGTVSCSARVDCPYSQGCYMHTNKFCKKNDDCMAFGEEYDGVVRCKVESGTCLYCPEGRESPVGSPLCQWGATKEGWEHPKPTEFETIMP